MTRLILQSVLAVAGAVAAATLAYRGFRPSAVPSWLTLTAIVTAAFVAAVSPIWAAAGDFLRKRAETAEQDAELALIAALWSIVDLLEASQVDIDFRDLGLGVYRLQQRRWRDPVLRRVHLVRARNRPAASGISWRPGLGVIGRCVQTGQVEFQDFSLLSDNAELQAADDWAELPSDVTLGLSWDQFTAARGKYGTIVAAPITASGTTGSTVVGCVALDGPPGREAELSGTAIVNRMGEAADGLLQRQH